VGRSLLSLQVIHRHSQIPKNWVLRYGVSMRFGVALIVCLLTACAGGDLTGGSGSGGGAGGGGGGGNSLPPGAECNPTERRCIGTTKTQVCSDDGKWSIPRGCVNGVCADGICTRSCEGACTPASKRCSPEGVQSCTRDGNGCGAWGEPSACPEGQECVGGGCQPQSCQSQCMAGMRRCIGANGYSECVVAGQCAEWSAGMQCPDGQSCSGGECQGSGEMCRDTCSEGGVTCSNARSFQRCQRQPSGCLDYSVPENCPAGQQCAEPGGCADVCGPPQCRVNEERCFQGGVQICVEDRRGCAVWGAIRPCGPGMACDGGVCIESCTPECVEGERRCEGGGYQSCGRVNGCPVWGAIDRCPPGTQCAGAGECGESCRPGDFEQRLCGVCGIQSRDCDGENWGAWQGCVEVGECSPGEERQCGNCGVQVCDNQCDWGACAGGGACAPGSTEECGECGVRQCDDQCAWGACGNSDNAWRNCRDCGWEFCCPEGDWCGDCRGRFPENCGEFGICFDNGVCGIAT